jgi:hypothetical protein
MIESSYWKEELKRMAKGLRPRNKPAPWTERAHCVLERELMVGFFMVRRLIELHKVSSKTREHIMEIFSYPARQKHVSLINHHDIEELYSLEKESREHKKPLYVSNQFIHAYTSFVLRDSTRNWSDVFIVSDFERNHCIWRVPIEEIRTLFLTAAEDYPHSTNMVYDPNVGDYLVSTN